jgi:hypothetical protein
MPPPLAPTTDPVRFSGTIFRMDGGRVGAPVASARLTIVSGANSNATVSTDGDGHYNFPSLAAGTFNLTISAPGFITLNPEVALGKDLEVDFVLSPE